MKVRNIGKFYSEEKTWIKVIFNNDEVWIPSFDELGKIIYLIGQCEDERYPLGKGLELTKEYFEEVILTGISYEEFCRNKGIPPKLKK